MANLKRPELKLGGNMSENFKNFELRFHDYCIQADYRNLAKNPETERADYYKKPLLEISALRSAMPDEALQVIRYTIEPQIAADDQKKPWIWMEKLRLHYTGSIGSSPLADRFKFWNTQQSPHESVQEWEVKVRQTGSLCSYNALTDEMCRDKFVFGLHDGTMRAELLKTHLKSDGMPKNMQDVVAEAKALESAQKANKLITDATKGIEEQVNWISHKQMKLKREPGTCFWCGDRRDFASQYGFKHTTSSPYHSQGNGRAEAAVKVSESMLKKSDYFQIALLNYRNTPPKGHTYSAQLCPTHGEPPDTNDAPNS